MDYPELSNAPVVKIEFQKNSLTGPKEFLLTVDDKGTLKPIKLVMQDKTTNEIDPPIIDGNKQLVCYAPALLAKAIQACCVVDYSSSNIVFNGHKVPNNHHYEFSLAASNLPVQTTRSNSRLSPQPGMIESYTFKILNVNVGNVGNNNFALVTPTYYPNQSSGVELDFNISPANAEVSSYFQAPTYHMEITGKDITKVVQCLNQCRTGSTIAKLDDDNLIFTFTPPPGAPEPTYELSSHCNNLPTATSQGVEMHSKLEDQQSTERR